MVQKEKIKKPSAVSMIGVSVTLTVLAVLAVQSLVFAQEEMVID